MSLAALLAAVEDPRGPRNAPDLARHLGIDVPSVLSMVDALRATGRLTGQTAEVAADCLEGASCGGGVCPGPSDCPLTLDLGVTTLGPA